MCRFLIMTFNKPGFVVAAHILCILHVIAIRGPLINKNGFCR